MTFWDGPELGCPLCEDRSLKEEQLANINDVRHAVRVNALEPHAAIAAPQCRKSVNSER